LSRFGSSLDPSSVGVEAVAAIDSGNAGRRTLSVHANAVALFLNVLVSAGFGYIAWLVTARIVAPETVGLAAAVVTSAMLCSNLAILGLGITIITFLPRELRDPAALLNGFFTIVVAAACLSCLTFTLVATAFLKHLHVLASNLLLGASFIALGTAMSVAILLDGTSVALRRADYALVRAAVAGVAKVLLLICAWLTASLSASTIVAAWAIATVGACLLGYKQIRSTFPSYRYRPRIAPGWARLAVTTGLSNHVLNLARLTPALAIPLVVTELLSPSENAYWYAAWMIAFLLRFIPETTAHATLAEITNRSASVATGIWRNMSSSFVVSLIAMIALITLAHPLLRLIGPQYASAGTTPLRLLALSIFPQIFTESYILVRRATMQLREANIAFGLVAVASIAAAAYGAQTHGLVGVAAGWLIVESAGGIWAAARLIGLVRVARREAAGSEGCS
jgi:O-antigen/teichoic acid export membrane protein